jgi:hypothetical protein
MTTTYCEIKNNELVINMDTFYPICNLPVEDKENKTYDLCLQVFQEAVHHLVKMNVWDTSYVVGVVHSSITKYLIDNNDLCETIVKEYEEEPYDSVPEYSDDEEQPDPFRTARMSVRSLMDEIEPEMYKQVVHLIHEYITQHEDGNGPAIVFHW